MSWLIAGEALYILAIILMCLKVIWDTPSSSKASAYILLIVLLPVVGMIIYLTFGINYRKKEIYSKKMIIDEEQKAAILQRLHHFSDKNLLEFEDDFMPYAGLSNLVFADTLSPLTSRNKVKLLTNGEEKFPELLGELENAVDHIHIEYYIFEDDMIGNRIANVLMRKAREGVRVRFIYDDFGSRRIRRKLVPELRRNGVEAFPFFRINFVKLANRINYRNHRKIVVIDGKTSFVGGINVSDRYINNTATQPFWRDSHLKIEGEATWFLQRVFIADWNFASGQKLGAAKGFFKEFRGLGPADTQWVQIVAAGPDSPNPSILYSYLQAISLAKKEVLITTPYFIPGQEIMESIRMALLKGVRVCLMVPEVSDSYLVNTASNSYFESLLSAGVEVYLYQKGFIHAKTMVCDSELAILGTANMDYRSFDLNFEANAIMYNPNTAGELRQSFLHDMADCRQLTSIEWMARPFYARLIEKVSRLIAPIL